MAMAIISSRINKSHHSHCWITQLKHIIILSRCVDQQLFCKDIAGYSLQLMDHLPDQNYHSINTRKLVRLFWHMIRHRAQFVASQNRLLAF